MYQQQPEQEHSKPSIPSHSMYSTMYWTEIPARSYSETANQASYQEAFYSTPMPQQHPYQQPPPQQHRQTPCDPMMPNGALMLTIPDDTSLNDIIYASPPITSPLDYGYPCDLTRSLGSPHILCDTAVLFGPTMYHGDCGSSSTSTTTSHSNSNSSNQPSPVQDAIDLAHKTGSVSFSSTVPSTPLPMAKAVSPPVEGTDARPYPCYTCSRCFARKHDLQRHTRVHTGDKPYICRCCKKAFARTDALKRHLRMEEVCRNSPEVQATKNNGKRRSSHSPL